MGIRTVDKNHLRPLAPSLTLAEVSALAPASDPEAASNPLVFWTLHTDKPCLVDLTVFETGQSMSINDGVRRWAGPFSGRPTLIRQLAPAIRDKLLFRPKDTCDAFIKHLRTWWRLFDALERPGANPGGGLPQLTEVGQLNDLHGQAALDNGLNSHCFSTLRPIADATRLALGLRPLYWRTPEGTSPKRHLPPPDKIARLWIELKHDWFNALDRWARVEAMLSGSEQPKDATDETLLAYCLHFMQTRDRVAAKDQRSHPKSNELQETWKRRPGSKRIGIAPTYRAFYPDADDIRAAFHLCLAGTGWNPQTLLDLPVDVSNGAESRTPFLRPHPSDANRYVLTGHKARGNSEHTIYGDWKTDRSPGSVMRTLIERTWPLRQAVLQELSRAEDALRRAQQDHRDAELNALRSEVESLRRASKSIWLYCGIRGIDSLQASNYAVVGPRSYLRDLVDRVNSRLPIEQHVPQIVAGDFRDAFAHYVWSSTGGSILHVMKALGHRRPQTTTIYLNNTVINQESKRIFRTFSNAMWEQLRDSDRLDATVLAKIAADGEVTPLERKRLDDYRALKRSRIGVSCKDPLHPPKSIDPNFVPDGDTMCTIQRCTLCFTHAVITPESLSGLVMRRVELHWLKSNTPVEAFTSGEFQQELDNTEAALIGFDPASVRAQTDAWSARIERGEHRVAEFQGVQRGFTRGSE